MPRRLLTLAAILALGACNSPRVSGTVVVNGTPWSDPVDAVTVEVLDASGRVVADQQLGPYGDDFAIDLPDSGTYTVEATAIHKVWGWLPETVGGEQTGPVEVDGATNVGVLVVVANDS